MKNLLTRALSGIALVVVMLFCVATGDEPAPVNTFFYLLWILILVGSLVELFVLTGKMDNTKVRNQWLAGGVVYIVAAIGVLITMGTEWKFVVALLTLVWANDVGAYLVGSVIGKHKMAPKTSPKKSWEGFAGGLVVAVGVAMLWHAYFSSNLGGMMFIDESTTAQILWAGLGLVTALGAVWGDLIESKIKRIAGVKDSGKFLPGHGGMLDRFDALFLAAPIFWFYLKFVLYL